MTDHIARYKNPTPVVVMLAIALTGGYLACFGMIADGKEVRAARHARNAEVMGRVIRVAVAEDRAEKHLSDEGWMDTMSACLLTEGCPKAVRAVKGLRR